MLLSPRPPALGIDLRNAEANSGGIKMRKMKSHFCLFPLLECGGNSSLLAIPVHNKSELSARRQKQNQCSLLCLSVMTRHHCDIRSAPRPPGEGVSAATCLQAARAERSLSYRTSPIPTHSSVSTGSAFGMRCFRDVQFFSGKAARLN
ncbi:hypothetical protein SKAU_G00300440 [Synaphobranchus kaupii]|uniref:Uncharacterized protein n=1 Tax=Synaphobranchus kaupii TaxID=118154 RepID=A0A9Q1IN89_SYNKA|nr:hypothetical protein SKAU_G00300440 [Synaphobranchus kaupii]